MQKMNLESERLSYRLLTEADVAFLTELDADPDVRYYLPGGAQTKEQTKARIQHYSEYYEEHGLPCLVIFDKKTNTFIGRARFRYQNKQQIEINFLLHKRFWGQGYASEILRTLLNWASISLAADEIVALTAIDHVASQKVLQKCGMERFKNDIAKGIECCFYKIKNKHSSN